MCGFAGITSSEVSELEIMAAKLHSRAIDAEYFHYEKDLSFYHAHLKISDLDKDTAQPFVYKDYVIGLVGEIYNKKYLLERIGITIEGDFYTECEVLARCYDMLGASFIDLVNGEFSVFIFDRRRSKYFLFRDRWGTKTLYYTKRENQLYFSSEIKSLTKPYSTLNKKNFIEHMVFQFGISPSTIVDDIFTLRPGTYLSFTKGEIELHTIGPYICREKGDIITVIEQSVVRRVPHFQEKIFVSLSGGPDSNIILHFLKKYYKGEIIAYSFLTERNIAEIEVAQRNANQHCIRHLIIDMNAYIPQDDSYDHEGLVSLPNIGKILRTKFPEYSTVKVEFGGDGKEELILSNTHFPYREIMARYRYFHDKGIIDTYTINQEFLNREMFDYNLQMIDKITLRNGIERRLPFTDYELFRFYGYKTYRHEAEIYLQKNGISIVNGEYGYNLGLKFSYLENRALQEQAIALLSKLRPIK